MKKTVNIDEKLLIEAKRACGAKTDTDTIIAGLELIVQHDAYQKLAALGGSENRLPFCDVPRRREKPRKRRVAA